MSLRASCVFSAPRSVATRAMSGPARSRPPPRKHRGGRVAETWHLREHLGDPRPMTLEQREHAQVRVDHRAEVDDVDGLAEEREHTAHPGRVAVHRAVLRIGLGQELGRGGGARGRRRRSRRRAARTRCARAPSSPSARFSQCRSESPSRSRTARSRGRPRPRALRFRAGERAERREIEPLHRAPVACALRREPQLGQEREGVSVPEVLFGQNAGRARRGLPTPSTSHSQRSVRGLWTSVSPIATWRPKLRESPANVAKPAELAGAELAGAEVRGLLIVRVVGTLPHCSTGALCRTAPLQRQGRIRGLA